MEEFFQRYNLLALPASGISLSYVLSSVENSTKCEASIASPELTRRETAAEDGFNQANIDDANEALFDHYSQSQYLPPIVNEIVDGHVVDSPYDSLRVINTEYPSTGPVLSSPTLSGERDITLGGMTPSFTHEENPRASTDSSDGVCETFPALPLASLRKNMGGRGRPPPHPRPSLQGLADLSACFGRLSIIHSDRTDSPAAMIGDDESRTMARVTMSSFNFTDAGQYTPKPHQAIDKPSSSCRKDDYCTSVGDIVGEIESEAVIAANKRPRSKAQQQARWGMQHNNSRPLPLESHPVGYHGGVEMGEKSSNSRSSSRTNLAALSSEEKVRLWLCENGKHHNCTFLTCFRKSSVALIDGLLNAYLSGGMTRVIDVDDRERLKPQRKLVNRRSILKTPLSSWIEESNGSSGIDRSARPGYDEGEGGTILSLSPSFQSVTASKPSHTAVATAPTASHHNDRSGDRGGLLIVTSKADAEAWAARARCNLLARLHVYTQSLAERRRFGVQNLVRRNVVVTTYDVVRAKEAVVPEQASDSDEEEIEAGKEEDIEQQRASSRHRGVSASGRVNNTGGSCSSPESLSDVEEDEKVEGSRGEGSGRCANSANEDRGDARGSAWLKPRNAKCLKIELSNLHLIRWDVIVLVMTEAQKNIRVGSVRGDAIKKLIGDSKITVIVVEEDDDLFHPDNSDSRKENRRGHTRENVEATTSAAIYDDRPRESHSESDDIDQFSSDENPLSPGKTRRRMQRKNQIGPIVHKNRGKGGDNTTAAHTAAVKAGQQLIHNARSIWGISTRVNTKDISLSI